MTFFNFLDDYDAQNAPLVRNSILSAKIGRSIIDNDKFWREKGLLSSLLLLIKY
jgi:hypothetical protein